MTGFGRARCELAGGCWEVECSSVNRKQLEVSVSLPREWNDAELEMSLRQWAQGQVSRGRVQVQIRGAGDRAQKNEALTRVDVEAARFYAEEMARLAAALGRTEAPGLSELLRLPGVLVQGSAAVVISGDERVGIQTAVAEAVQAMIQMRATEGAHLAEDLLARMRVVEGLREQAAELAPQVLLAHRQALMRRLEEAGVPLPLDDERLLKELALYADRCDISEELTRIDSHVKQFHLALASEEAVGRSLHF